MRTRILAFIILILFLVLPFIGYWIFFRMSTTILTLTPEDKTIVYHLKLSGTLKYKYLPLADTVLHFERECQGICILSLPPVSYDMVLTASGMETIHELITPEYKKETKYTPEFIRTFTYEKEVLTPSSPALEESLLQNANTHFSGSFIHIGTSRGGKYYAVRLRGGQAEVGIITPDSFIQIFSLPSTPDHIGLDRSRQYIVFSYESNAGQNIISLDGRQSTIFPNNTPISIIDHDTTWKVQSDTGVYTFEGEKWKLNPRFSDYIDVSPTVRIGYIDSTDTKKLSLQNYNPGTSLLIMISRDTGKYRIIKQGLDIMGFFHFDGRPAFIDREGHIGILPSF